MVKSKLWPTPEIPEAPVGVDTHGPMENWTEEEYRQFHEWALSLRYYPELKTKKPKVKKLNQQLLI